ncbi:MAG: DUF3313 domain-containing protein [Planctomycetota bacterium]|jgi:hypothetical protein
MRRRSTHEYCSRLSGLFALMCFTVLTGCAPKAPITGYLSDYSNLRKDKDDALRFISPDLRNYNSFMIEPVQVRAQKDPPVLKPEERAEIAQYLKDALAKALKEAGFALAENPDVGVAIVRMAITDVDKSKWYLNIHPASKLSGAGAGGAAMEGEVIDSVTGVQLAGVVQATRGNQFDLTNFSGLDGIKDVVDRWAQRAGERLQELRERAEQKTE